jgi:hypothetical protein
VLAGGLQDMEGDFDMDEEFELLEQENELLSGVGTAASARQNHANAGAVAVRAPTTTNLIEDEGNIPSRGHAVVPVDTDGVSLITT